MNTSSENTPALSYAELNRLDGAGVDHSGEFKLLIVDDNEFDIELVVRELKHQDQVAFVHKAVTNKADYETALREFLPDVVYCDLNITYDFSGTDAIRILKKEYPEVPFVLVTGALNEEVVSICISEGIDDYVLKTNMSRLPVSLINAVKIRKIEMQKKEAYEKLVKAEAQVRNFARHLNQVLEDERASIAREIHDELGQQLAGIKIGISTFKKLGYAGSNIEEKVNGMMKDMDGTIGSLRKIAQELRPAMLDALGLIASLEWLAQEFHKKTEIECVCIPQTTNRAFDRNTSICYFRICQEALTNISKHAGASKVTIRIDQQGDRLCLKVSDNGKGITSEKLENPFSMGLLGMRERAGLIGARLLILSTKDIGTTVQLQGKVTPLPDIEPTPKPNQTP